jgi:hypothetical protein
MTTETEYAIRDAKGVVRAVHVRWDGPDGKRLAWRSPDGRDGLQGAPLAGLPLYGSERVADWPIDNWIVVTEGEKDADALWRCTVPALGTVTGAASAPTPEALAEVAAGRRFVTWPDNDLAGRQHMSIVGANLWRAGAHAVRTFAYDPAVFVGWPKGTGAADLLDGQPPVLGLEMVRMLLEEYGLPTDRPRPQLRTVRTSPRRDNREWGSVSAALIAAYGVNAKPGRNARCPMHDDRQASLSVLRDDLRAICKSPECLWSGHGVVAVGGLVEVAP